MDRISYNCAREINDVLAFPMLRACHGQIKVYRHPCTTNGGHPSDPFLDEKYWDDHPEDDDDDTIIAPDWDDLRKCLNFLNPSDFILSEFEAIENIDEFAYKLVEYFKRKKNENTKWKSYCNRK